MQSKLTCGYLVLLVEDVMSEALLSQERVIQYVGTSLWVLIHGLWFMVCGYWVLGIRYWVLGFGLGFEGNEQFRAHYSINAW